MPTDVNSTANPLQKIRRALAQSACQIISNEPFPIFRNVIETFAIEANSSSHLKDFFNFQANSNSHFQLDFFGLFSKLLQSKPTQAAISEQFFAFRSQLEQPFPIRARIRATIRARAEIEQEFELELLFLFENRAREAASLGAIGHRDRESFSSGGGLFF